jgi:thiamine biosynthesis lipoprotein
MTVFHEDQTVAKRAMEAAFAEIERLEQIMSLYRPESQLSVLNRNGHLRHPHPDLLGMLRTSKSLSERSGGAFDVTVQPLWEVYSRCRWEGRLPGESELRLARAKVGWQHMRLSDDEILLEKAGCQITLNGIAQGFAADAALRVLDGHGIRHALVDAGEFAAHGRPAGRDAWKVAIKHPRRAEPFAAEVPLKDFCLATSGDYETYFSPDFRDNHLLDPRTGCSPLHFASVSVLAPTACEADALSTALFVLGLDKGRKLLESTPGTDALWIAKDGTAEWTPGFPAENAECLLKG